jgi:hypothetical protein
MSPQEGLPPDFDEQREAFRREAQRTTDEHRGRQREQAVADIKFATTVMIATATIGSIALQWHNYRRHFDN